MSSAPEPLVPKPKHRRTVFRMNGGSDYGFITSEMALAAGIRPGPIRLLMGFEGNNGGFGLAHIEAKDGRSKQFASLGFRSCQQVVERVCEQFTRLYIGKNGRPILTLDHQSAILQVIIEFDEAEEFWSVTTAIPVRAVRLQAVWISG